MKQIPDFPAVRQTEDTDRPRTMPGLARKILVFAAVDGLVIQPLASKGQKPFQSARIKYGGDASVSAARDQAPDQTKPDSWFEALGVIGECEPVSNGR